MSGHLTPVLALVVLAAYFGMLAYVAWRTGRRTGNEGFFLADRRVAWPVVAFAMIGTSISGVTFISIPGKVGAGGLNQSFSYMQMVLGYSLGYLFVGAVLLPLYYRLGLTSIYTYLEGRLGRMSYKTGAAFFLVARTFGSAARMFLAALVLQEFVFGPLGVPFVLTAVLMLALIYVYTFSGGLKTIIWTDTIMTAFLLIALVWTVATLAGRLGLGALDIAPAVARSAYSKLFFWENFWTDPNHFVKQFAAGALTVIAMTGLDQDLMQKNLACRSLREAQKNMGVFYAVLVVVNLLFLTLGALLYLYAAQVGLQMPAKSDALYPTVAFQHLDVVAGIVFMLGLVASTYASSDSALTALTTSFCIDFLGFEKNKQHPDEWATEAQKIEYQQLLEKKHRRQRTQTHLGFAAAFVVVILFLKAVSDEAVINTIFKMAGYTYGPLLGLFTFGLFTRLQVRDRWVPLVCVAAPVLTWLIVEFSKKWWGLDLGFLNLLVNGALTFFGLWGLSFRLAARD